MSKGLRIAKIGKNVFTSTDPNDFVFNSDYATPLIVDDVIATTTLDANTAYDLSYSHGLGYAPFTFPKATQFSALPLRVLLPGGQDPTLAIDFEGFYVTSTELHWLVTNNEGTAQDVALLGEMTNIPLAGTPNFPLQGGKRLVIGKPGINVFTETNPNNLVYDSADKTFKYFSQGTTTVSIPSGSPPNSYSQVLSNHALGYYPHFDASISFDSGATYESMPESFADAGFEHRHDIYLTNQDLVFRYFADNSFASSEGGYDVSVKWRIYSYAL